jgi:hypothetical protein
MPHVDTYDASLVKILNYCLAQEEEDERHREGLGFRVLRVVRV